MSTKLARGAVALVAGLLSVVGVSSAFSLRMPPMAEGDPEARQEASRCEAEEVHAFDFWIGTWTVTNPEGDTLGVNRIRSTASGCGLLEEWRGAAGGVGTSLTAYDPGRDEWFQHWVGDGAVLKLTGHFRDGSLVLTGLPRVAERPDGRVELVDRITWTPLEAARVRQAWDVSSDGGETWDTAFVGIYHPDGRD